MQNISTITTLNKIKELEDIAIVIDFNEHLETISARLENLDTGVKAIIGKDNIY